MDCLEFMKEFPDKFFEIAIVDPPYQLGTGNVNKNKSTHSGAGKLKSRVLNQQAGKFEKWDIAPTKEYWDELFRVSKNQIIWGGNYFPLPPTRCIVVWDKVQPWENFSQVEIAWTSFDYPAKLFRFDNRTGDKIHACQKPIELYAYLIKNFCNSGDKILDTHLGSGSSRIAAYKMGYDFYGSEIDSDYFKSSCDRFDKECLGIERINGHTITQQSLF